MEFTWTQGIIALLVIAATVIPYILKRKEVWPFKPRLKKIKDIQKKKEQELDGFTHKKDDASYNAAADDILDNAERLRQVDNKSKTDK